MSDDVTSLIKTPISLKVKIPTTASRPYVLCPAQPPPSSPTPNTPSLSGPSSPITLVLTHVALAILASWTLFKQTKHILTWGPLYIQFLCVGMLSSQRSKVPSLNFFLSVPNVTYCHLTNIHIYTYTNGSLTPPSSQLSLSNAPPYFIFC